MAIAHKDGIPEIINRKLIIDNDSVYVDAIRYRGIIEPQAFRPPDNRELIWSQYGTDDHGRFTSEVFGYDLETGELFPDGRYTLVECDMHDPQGTKNIDIYKLLLDTKPPPAFQASISGTAAGVGCGIYIMEFE